MQYDCGHNYWSHEFPLINEILGCTLQICNFLSNSDFENYALEKNKNKTQYISILFLSSLCVSTFNQGIMSLQLSPLDYSLHQTGQF